MASSIQLSKELQELLAKRKLSDSETYEEVIWDLIEDTLELSDQTKKDIKKARADFQSGRYMSHAQVKKQLGL